MKHNIALIGFGTVGQGISEILLSKKQYLKDKYNFKFEIVAVADFAYGNCYNPKGLDVQQMLEEAQATKKFSKDLYEKDTFTLIKKSNADIVCELT